MMNDRKYLPIWIIIASVLVGIAHFLNWNYVPIRVVTFLYLIVCPGLIFIRFMKLEDKVTEIALGITLSLIIVSILAMISVYSGFWNPSLGVYIIIFITISGAAAQLYSLYTK